ncbi:MAG: hypothetical protein ACN4GW_14065 [Desulforhopalus sp.]
MDRLKYLVIGILALVLTGCGQTVVETLNVAGGPGQNGPGSGKSIVILPFADYSQGNLASAQRRNMTITESMTDRLVTKGFGMPIQEDVFDYLVRERIIQLASSEGANTTSLDYELMDVWSDEMKSMIQFYKEQVESEASQGVDNAPGTRGLTTKTVAKIGRHFEADYIVRGRILEFKTRQEATWLPWKKGLLPFVNGGTSKILTGFASSDDYDETNEMLTGMILGAIGGNNGWSIFGLEGNSWGANQIVWAGIGGYAGKVSHRSGKVDQAAVQMRVWVQEAATGNVVWTNRVRVLVSPETMFADNQYDTLFNSAIDKGVETLINDFVTYGL